MASSKKRPRGNPSKRPNKGGHSSGDRPEIVKQPRIIGGRFRGRKLAYSGDIRTRPMKDRVREAIFNLVGPAIKGKHAVDLFAGTGALGLESISRGALSSTLIERHLPTGKIIRENAESLDVTDICQIVVADTFYWIDRNTIAADHPWVVYCSPPYDLYCDKCEQMVELIAKLVEAAPLGSIFVVEADERFDFGLLPQADEWDVRTYRPAVVGILG